MNKIYFVESELCSRIQFDNESDRNEMALALWEEHIYFLWARTMNWYEGPIFTGIEEDANANIFTWDAVTYFNVPTQVAFWDADYDRYCAGIAYCDEVICACCGSVIELNEVYELAPRGVTPIVAYKNWIPFNEEIIHDNEKWFKYNGDGDGEN